MLQKISIKNFKSFESVDIELGPAVVFIGPNNSGKTSALQALTLWEMGVRRWTEKRSGKATPEKRPGVTLNRRDLVTVPVPDAIQLWHDTWVRDVQKTNGKQQTRNIRIDIMVEGISDGRLWACGFEFDYANEESFYCRPLRVSEEAGVERLAVPPEAEVVRVAYLPPMCGLAANETRIDEGAINVRIGDARTAEVLRNVCHLLKSRDHQEWERLCKQIKELFGIELDAPVYVSSRGEITMTYRTRTDVRLDLSTAGRGLQQTLLILAHLSLHPGAVLLLDEPDAHLEILRQRHIYNIITNTARRQGSQIIAASHSEVILNEAADKDVVVAFVGRPHRIDDRGSQVAKSLKEIGFEHYYQAEQRGWVLYLEGATDLAILAAFAEQLEHPAHKYLKEPFVKYVQNSPKEARNHFYGLRAAKPDLVGFALFDHMPGSLQERPDLIERMWSCREIENYFCTRDVLLAWAEERGASEHGPLFRDKWKATMVASIAEIESALESIGNAVPWSKDIKATDEFLNPIFRNFCKRMGLPFFFDKTDYHALVRFVPPGAIDKEVVSVLDAIVRVAQQARPLDSGV